MREIVIQQNTIEFNLREVCERCCVDAETIIKLVDYGVAEPVGSACNEWRFSASSYFKIKKALRLQKDLSLNASGVALVIDLLDRLQTANQEINYLKKRFERE